jgi:putative endonuclease
MPSTKETGQEAENLAVTYLTAQGYEILERNWFHHHQELDIIAKKDRELIVVEVKSRSGNFISEPQAAVNRNKQQLIISATNGYIRQKNIDLEVRFDIISIIFTRAGHTLEHIENAFYPRVRKI